MSQLTDYSLELMAKGWVSLNKDKPEHVQVVELAKLLKELKSVYEKQSSPNRVFPITWFNKKFATLPKTMEGYCEFTGEYGTLTLIREVGEERKSWWVNANNLFVFSADGCYYKIIPGTVLL